jgi:glutamine---fructose-6-phosphate transaminase (isomerizing)
MRAAWIRRFASLVGKYWIERFAGLPLDIDVASECRYREAPVETNGLTVSSRNRTRRPTLWRRSLFQGQRVEDGRGRHAPTSSIACLPTRLRRRWPDRRSASLRPRPSPVSWQRSPAWRSASAAHGLLAEALKLEPAAETLRMRSLARNVLYSGRGTAYSLALEGTLKLKKLSYIHVEGYPAGELKHGLIARIDDAMPVIIIAPRDAVFEKSVSNMREIAARCGRIVPNRREAWGRGGYGRDRTFPADAGHGRQFRADRLRRCDPVARRSYSS